MQEPGIWIDAKAVGKSCLLAKLSLLLYVMQDDQARNGSPSPFYVSRDGPSDIDRQLENSLKTSVVGDIFSVDVSSSQIT